MCCDGTLFSRVKAAPDEEPGLAEIGFALAEIDGHQWFSQPCPMSNCGSCAIYESRPATCRRYRCDLLKAFEAAEIEYDEAVKKIASAKSLLAAVVADDPAACQDRHRMDCWRRYADALAAGDAQERDEVGPKLLRVVALESFLRRWFRNPDVPEDGVTR